MARNQTLLCSTLNEGFRRFYVLPASDDQRHALMQLLGFHLHDPRCPRRSFPPCLLDDERDDTADFMLSTLRRARVLVPVNRDGAATSASPAMPARSRPRS